MIAIAGVPATTASDRTAAVPQAILLQDVETLGERGAVVDVSKGYLRNFLIPRKLAEPATKASIEAAKRRETAAERAVAQATARAEEEAELLNKTVLTIAHQAGDDGRLFGSVTSQDIADAIRDARGIKIDRRKIHLDEPIKTVGTRMISVEIGDGVVANVKTMVVEQK
jgi:large subunit ribosomal protein L9